MRTFEVKAATRQQVPLLIGLVGCAGSGKTFSALRLATGIQRVSGGDIHFIDSEARRALWYADQFKFKHVDFLAPFGPLDYLAAIETCVKDGAKTIIVDSFSNEHAGVGGVLEMHEAESQRLAKQWNTTLDKVKMSAWQRPKAERAKLLNTMLQLPVNFLLCFRAKEKMDLSSAKPASLGWMPVAAEEVVFEMSLNALLYPSSGGVPSWQPDEKGEKAIIKLPGQFRDIFAKKEPLSEDIGEKLARWAAGGSLASKPATAAPSASITPEMPTAEFDDVIDQMKLAPDLDSAKFIANKHRAGFSKAQGAVVRSTLENWNVNP